MNFKCRYVKALELPEELPLIALLRLVRIILQASAFLSGRPWIHYCVRSIQLQANKTVVFEAF